MSQQRRTIIGACEYSIASMQNLKKSLQQIDSHNPELNWAVGGIISTLVSNLIQICDQVFQESIANGQSNAKDDLMEIKQRLGAFMDRMVDHE